jgi:hypothetical protein
MIPSDHFVRFYNEVFKYLDEKDALADYYTHISKHQELHCLELFKSKGVQGMYEYWDHIRIEENCDMDLEIRDDSLILTMNKCPSLSKNLDNDAGLCEKYCEHCPGWVIPLVEKAGFCCRYNIADRRIPKCQIIIFPAMAGKKSEIIEKIQEFD